METLTSVARALVEATANATESLNRDLLSMGSQVFRRNIRLLSGPLMLHVSHHQRARKFNRYVPRIEIAYAQQQYAVPLFRYAREQLLSVLLLQHFCHVNEDAPLAGDDAQRLRGVQLPDDGVQQQDESFVWPSDTPLGLMSN